MNPPPANTHRVTVRVEVPRGGRVKRELHGAKPQFDYWSPIASPFNYGFIEGLAGADGDPLDAVLLGPTVESGARISCEILGVVRFIDAGQPDDKWVCGNAALTPQDIRRIERFFRRYAWLKRPLQWLRGDRGETAFLGFERDVAPPASQD